MPSKANAQVSRRGILRGIRCQTKRIDPVRLQARAQTTPYVGTGAVSAARQNGANGCHTIVASSPVVHIEAHGAYQRTLSRVARALLEGNRKRNEGVSAACGVGTRTTPERRGARLLGITDLSHQNAVRVIRRSDSGSTVVGILLGAIKGKRRIRSNNHHGQSKSQAQ